MYEEEKIGLKSTPTLYPSGATYQIWLSPVVLEKKILTHDDGRQIFLI